MSLRKRCRRRRRWSSREGRGGRQVEAMGYEHESGLGQLAVGLSVTSMRLELEPIITAVLSFSGPGLG